jgi:hypothetical protein
VLVDGHQRFGSCDTGGLAHKALRLPPVKHQSVMKESDALGQRLRSQKKILALQVDTETPESFMLHQSVAAG